MIISKIKELIKRVVEMLGERDIFIIFLFVLSVIISFNLGRYAENEDKKRIEVTRSTLPIKTLEDFKKTDTSNISTTSSEKQTPERTIWGSRNGTKFYYAWCSGASRVKEENRIYYSSKEEAENNINKNSIV